MIKAAAHRLRNPGPVAVDQRTGLRDRLPVELGVVAEDVLLVERQPAL